MNNKKKNSGFTLVEITIVIAIIGIISITSLPVLFKHIGNAKVSRVEADFNIIKNSTSQFLIDNNKYPVWITSPYENELEDYIGDLSKKSALGGEYYLLDTRTTSNLKNNMVYSINSKRELDSKGKLLDLGSLFLVIDFDDEFEKISYENKSVNNNLYKLTKDLDNVYLDKQKNSSYIENIFIKIK